MLNSLLPAQIQIQTKQPTINSNDLTRINESNKTEGKQFDNVLAREMADKKQTPTERSAGDKSNTNAKSEGSTEDKSNTPNETGDSNSGNTTESSVQTKPNNERESSQKNEANQIGITENSASNTIIPPPQVATAPGLSSNQSGLYANNANLIQAPVIASDHLLSQPELLQNAKHSLPTNQNSWQLLQTADNSAGDGKILPPAFNPSGNFLENNGLRKSAYLTNIINNGSTPQFSIDAKQNPIGSQDFWQLLQAANFTGNDKISELSANTGQDSSVRFFEPGSLLQADSDTMFQSGLNNLSQTLSQTTSHAAVSQHIDLDAPIGQPKWNGEFAQKIVWLANHQHQFAELRLNPAHLGPVEIMLSLTNDNGTQASAQFVSPHLAVREAIEAALPRLRELMAESGIQLGDVMVGAESFQQQDRGEQQANQSNRDTRIVNTHNNSDTNRESTIAIGRHNGIVNTFA